MNRVEIMKILYLSDLCSEKKILELYRDLDNTPAFCAINYHRIMAEGLAANKKVRVKAVTTYPVTRTFCKEYFIKKGYENINGVDYIYLFTINFPCLKHMISLIQTIFCCFKFLRKNKDGIVIVDSLKLTISIAALVTSKVLKRKCVGIVTDLPCFFNTSALNRNFHMKILQQFSHYIFLTQDMNKIVNKKNRPYIVLEGQVDIKMKSKKTSVGCNHKRKICMYTGAISKEYGLDLLVEAFIKVNSKDWELLLYGNGSYVKEYKNLCKVHQNISYGGVKLNSYILDEQSRADLLVNPRPSSDEYTKYSFPSKNMEYMVSGTPVLTTKLPGMPKDYYSYVYLFEEESVEGYCKTFVHLFSLDSKELIQKGQEAKKFILDQKNNVRQAEKIIHMVEESEE